MAEGWNSLSASWFRAEIYRPGCLVYENPNRVAIQYRFTGVQTTTAKKDTSIRYQGGIKSPILTDVKTGDTLIFLEELED